LRGLGGAVTGYFDRGDAEPRLYKCAEGHLLIVGAHALRSMEINAEPGVLEHVLAHKEHSMNMVLLPLLDAKPDSKLDEFEAPAGAQRLI